MKISLVFALLFACSALTLHAEPDKPVSAEVVVYSGSPAGVMAAVAAARKGHSVVLVDMNNHIGGVVSGGLCYSDLGDPKTIGGLSREFFERVTDYYRKTYGEDSKQFAACENGLKFEPKIAEKIFDEMLAEAKVTVWKNHRIRSVARDASGNIVSFAADDLKGGGQRTFSGSVFVDASYEGDLMAMAGVPYTFGREGRDEYSEYIAGIGVGPDKGKADHRIMSYNYRVTITSDTDNAVPFYKPENYDPEPFRQGIGKSVVNRKLTKFIDLFVTGPSRAGPNDKYDVNWFDAPDSTEGYADGDWKAREKVAQHARDRAQGLLYFLRTDPMLPAAFRADVEKWGYPRDEYTDNNHFSFQLYVREARRMKGLEVLTEQDLSQNRYKADGVAAGSYGIDCHAIRILEIDGKRILDNTRHYPIPGYDIPYGVLCPPDKKGQPGNLLVPLCCSASHVAYCSLRMEPVYMMLGHAAGDAAHLALKNKTPVQKVDTDELRALLRQEKAVLDANYQPQVRIAFSPVRPQPGQPVQFSIEKGELRDPLAKVVWDFERDGRVGSTEETPKHTFTTGKTHTVSLIIEDRAGRRRIISAEVPVGAGGVHDLTLDDSAAALEGRWVGDFPRIEGRIPDVFIGPGILRQQPGEKRKSPEEATYPVEVPHEGLYRVCLAFRPDRRQAANVPVTIGHSGGEARLMVDMKKETTPFPFVAVGEFRFKPGHGNFVKISNKEADGTVSTDGIRLVWLGE